MKIGLVSTLLLICAGCGASDVPAAVDEPTVTMPPPGTGPSVPVSTTTSTPLPGTNPTTDPGTSVPVVTRSTTVPSTTEVPGSDDGPFVGGTGTLWYRSYLVGRFVDSEFESGTAPAGVVGTEIELLGPTGNRRVAAVVECALGELQLSVDAVGGSQMSEIWRTDGLSWSSAPPDTDAGLAEMEADLAAHGIDPAASVSFGNEFAADGSIDRLMIVDGWATSGVATPTWIATWNATTGEFTTIEGDPDPAQALSIGSVDPTWLDLDRDGNWEIAYPFGDAILVQELATKEIIMATGAQPCPSDAARPPLTTGGLDGPVVFGRYVGYAMEALLYGVLRLEEGCLVIEARATNASGTDFVEVYLPIFPNGTTWSADELAVQLPSGETVVVGTDTSLGGGGVGVERADDFVTDPAALDQLGACYANQRAKGLWAM